MKRKDKYRTVVIRTLKITDAIETISGMYKSSFYQRTPKGMIRRKEQDDKSSLEEFEVFFP